MRRDDFVHELAHASFYPGQDLHHMAVCLMFRSCMLRLCLSACCVGTSGRAGGETVTKAELSGQVSWDDVIVFFSGYNTPNVMRIFSIQISWRETDISVWSVTRSEIRSKWSRVLWLTLYNLGY
jgi:hypothetical protein